MYYYKQKDFEKINKKNTKSINNKKYNVEKYNITRKI